MSKTHLLSPKPATTECGLYGSGKFVVTADESKVTCKRCLWYITDTDAPVTRHPGGQP